MSSIPRGDKKNKYVVRLKTSFLLSSGYSAICQTRNSEISNIIQLKYNKQLQTLVLTGILEWI